MAGHLGIVPISKQHEPQLATPSHRLRVIATLVLRFCLRKHTALSKHCSNTKRRYISLYYKGFWKIWKPQNRCSSDGCFELLYGFNGCLSPYKITLLQ